MYRWNWFILCVLVISLIRTSGSVGVSPPLIEILPSHDLNPHWQTTFTFKCLVPEWPGSPVFFWKRDGSTLYPYADNKIIFSSNKQSIIFNDATQQQSGTYFCVAAELREYIFESSTPVQIAVKEPPQIPINLAVNSKTSTSLQLLWEPQGHITADYYIITQRPDDIELTADKPVILISQLNPYSMYTFTVSAYNSVGSRGNSMAFQTRTEPGPPTAVLSFTIGRRTSSSVEMEWSVPASGVNDKLTGFSLMVHATNQNALVISFNFTANTTRTVVSELLSGTQYTFSMAFLTRCCTSNYDSKDAWTTKEGETVSPSDESRSEGNTVSSAVSDGVIVGISVGCGVLLLLLLAIVLYFRFRSSPSTHTPLPTTLKPHSAWDDGTDNAADDTMAPVPISPPPVYTQAAPPQQLPQLQEPSLSIVHTVSLSRSFSYDPIHSPPPAYHSRTSSNNDNSSISDLSNVDTTEHEIKEMNVPVLPRVSSITEYNGPREGPPRDTEI